MMVLGLVAAALAAPALEVTPLEIDQRWAWGWGGAQDLVVVANADLTVPAPVSATQVKVDRGVTGELAFEDAQLGPTGDVRLKTTVKGEFPLGVTRGEIRVVSGNVVARAPFTVTRRLPRALIPLLATFGVGLGLAVRVGAAQRVQRLEARQAADELLVLLEQERAARPDATFRTEVDRAAEGVRAALGKPPADVAAAVKAAGDTLTAAITGLHGRIDAAATATAAAVGKATQPRTLPAPIREPVAAFLKRDVQEVRALLDAGDAAGAEQRLALRKSELGAAVLDAWRAWDGAVRRGLAAVKRKSDGWTTARTEVITALGTPPSTATDVWATLDTAATTGASASALIAVLSAETDDPTLKQAVDAGDLLAALGRLAEIPEVDATGPLIAGTAAPRRTISAWVARAVGLPGPAPRAPLVRGAPATPEPRSDTAADLAWARATSTALGVVVVSIVALGLYGPTFQGTLPEVVAILLWAFGLDLGAESLTTLAGGGGKKAPPQPAPAPTPAPPAPPPPPAPQGDQPATPVDEPEDTDVPQDREEV